MSFDEAAANNAIFSMAREAGLEDGIDFVVTNPRRTYSNRFWSWFSKNRTELTLRAFSESAKN